MCSITPPPLHYASVIEGFAAGHLVQQLSTCFNIQIRGEHLISRRAQLMQPCLILGSKLLLQFFPKSLRERRAAAIGGNGNLQVTPLHYCSVVEITIFGIVDRIAENVSQPRFPEDLAIHFA
jgi:hypothetical protein